MRFGAKNFAALHSGDERVGAKTGSDSRSISFPARFTAVGQDAGGFSNRRICPDGGGVTFPGDN